MKELAGASPETQVKYLIQVSHIKEKEISDLTVQLRTAELRCKWAEDFRYRVEEELRMARLGFEQEVERMRKEFLNHLHAPITTKKRWWSKFFHTF